MLDIEARPPIENAFTTNIWAVAGDVGGAAISGNPMGLANARRKLEMYGKSVPHERHNHFPGPGRRSNRHGRTRGGPGHSSPGRPVSDAAPPALQGAPAEASLGVQLFPDAQSIPSYDAGRGQPFYLFGTDQSFVAVVTHYRTLLKQRGKLVFEAPAAYQFARGRLREETMASPPSVTVKDYHFRPSSRLCLRRKRDGSDRRPAATV